MNSSKTLLILSLFATAACSSKRVFNDENITFTKNNIIEINVSSIKDKGKKFDIEMTITNISKKDIIIMLNDISCSKGTLPGTLKHTFFNTGERTIDFRIAQSKQFRMVCDIKAKVQGDFKLTINRIFENPNSDGATKGDPMGEKVEWSGH